MLFDDSARARMLRGVEKLANAVAITTTITTTAWAEWEAAWVEWAAWVACPA